MLKNKFLLILLLWPGWLLAQNGNTGTNTTDTAATNANDNANTDKVYAIKTVFVTEDSILFKPFQYSKIDTTLNELDILDNGLKGGKYYRRINNFGSAAYNLEFNPLRRAGFNLGLVSHQLNNITANSLHYYDSYSPYTQFRYVQGDGQLQVLDMFHSQNLTERWNIGITYHSIKSTGFYAQEANRVNNVSLHSKYTNATGNYCMLAYGIWNTSDLNENGGVQGLDQFATPAFSSKIARVGQPVNLSDGAYWYRNGEVGIRQFKFLGKRDSFKVRGFGMAPRFVPRAYLTHKLSYTRNKTKFNTANPGYFDSTYTSINKVFDVVEHREVSNELGLGIYLNRKEVLERDSNVIKKPYAEQVFYTGIDMKVGRAGFWGLESLTNNTAKDLVQWTNYANLHVFANLSKKLTPVTNFKGSLNYVAAGTQFSDYEGEFAIRQVLFKKLSLSPFLHAEAVSPMFLQNNYYSNFARWTNDFKKEFHNSLGATLCYNVRTSISVTANRSDNYIFYDQAAQPEQMTTGINYFQIKMHKLLRLGKFFFDNTVAWQTITKESPYQVPQWLAFINYYFQTPLFKEAATVRIGLRGRYYSAFRSMAYMPGLAMFYVNDAATNTGGYPAFDFYLSANIKKWNGYVKYEHVSDGMFGYSYEMLAGYPMPPRALRMGVAWRFYD